MVPEPSGFDEDYNYLMTWMGALSTLFQNIGLGLFILSTFLGAVTDRALSKQVKAGLAIAAGIGLIALIVIGGIGMQLQIIWLM